MQHAAVPGEHVDLELGPGPLPRDRVGPGAAIRDVERRELCSSAGSEVRNGLVRCRYAARASAAVPGHGSSSHVEVASEKTKSRTRPVAPSTRTANLVPPRLSMTSVPLDAVPRGENE